MKISFSIEKLWILLLILGIVYYAFTIDTYILNEIYGNSDVLVLILVTVVYFAMKLGVRRFDKSQTLWLMFAFYAFINMLFLNGFESTVYKMHFAWVLLCILIVLLSKSMIWEKVAYYLILILTVFHTLSAWFYYLNPTKYASDILSIAEEPYRSSLISVMNNGAILGFANFYSATGMYVSIGCIAIFSYALCSKEKKWHLITLAMLMSLFMTAKRGVTLFSIITMILVYLIAAGNRVKSVLKTYSRLIIAVVCATALLLILGNSVLPSIMGMFERSKILVSTGDISANRFILWAGALRVFLRHPIFGCGWGNFTNVSGLAETCSTYLELLSSTGIIGFVLFLMAAVNTLVITIKKFKFVIQQTECVSFNEKLIISFALSMQLLFLLYSFTGQAIVLPPMYISYFLSCAMGLAFKTQR